MFCPLRRNSGWRYFRSLMPVPWQFMHRLQLHSGHAQTSECSLYKASNHHQLLFSGALGFSLDIIWQKCWSSIINSTMIRWSIKYRYIILSICQNKVTFPDKSSKCLTASEFPKNVNEILILICRGCTCVKVSWICTCIRLWREFDVLFQLLVQLDSHWQEQQIFL